MEKNPRENRILKTRFSKLQKNAAIGLKNATIGLPNLVLIIFFFAGKRCHRALKHPCQA